MTALHTETIPLVDESDLQITVAEPEGAVRGGVVVLHETRGVTERTEAIVSVLAGEGWLAVAPHLYHRLPGASGATGDEAGASGATGDDAGATGDDEDAARLVSGESLLADSDASFGWLAARGISSDRMGVLGFDLGASAALVVASQRSLGATVTVSASGIGTSLADGLPPLVEVVGELTCPWLGLYGEWGDPVDPDEIERLREAAHASGRVVDVVVYPAREHRFDIDEAAEVPDEVERGVVEEATRGEARSRVLNWLDAHLR